jgi:hypothetical protein
VIPLHRREWITLGCPAVRLREDARRCSNVPSPHMMSDREVVISQAEIVSSSNASRDYLA